MFIVGAKYISQLLTVTHTLKELGIGKNDVGDDGIRVISETLQHNPSFIILRIGKCGLSAKGTIVWVRCNADIPTQTFCINIFDLCYTYFKVAVEQLQAPHNMKPYSQ